jgi:hypothetical protein
VQVLPKILSPDLGAIVLKSTILSTEAGAEAAKAGWSDAPRMLNRDERGMV